MYKDQIPVAVCLDTTIETIKLSRDTPVLSGVITHAPNRKSLLRKETCRSNETHTTHGTTDHTYHIEYDRHRQSGLNFSFVCNLLRSLLTETPHSHSNISSREGSALLLSSAGSRLGSEKDPIVSCPLEGATSA